MAHILLADDDAATLDIVSRALAAEGHTVIIAHDGQDALEKATASVPPVDVLVTDVQMPLLDGVALAEQLRSVNAGLRIVLMSGLPGEAVRASRISGPRAVFLPKPFTLEQIRAVVRHVLA
jgi:CheY-like chemotaxis protein